MAATVAFVGLGRMGFPMARRLAEKFSVLGWNRSQLKEFPAGVTSVADLQGVSSAKYIFTCVTTSAVVKDLVDRLSPHLKSGTVIVDCTTGDPDVSIQIAKQLELIGVGFLDAPISGGITGAAKGTLTTMVGGKTELFNELSPIISAFSNNIVHAGDVGAGHALKGINNLMNVAHLMIASEGLVALAKRGIKPEVALQAINSSSGRSLATTSRFPEHILPRKFTHGFTMELMDKDVNIGVGVLKSSYPPASIMVEAARVFHQAEEFVGPQADYTESVKYFEHLAGVILQNSSEH